MPFFVTKPRKWTSAIDASPEYLAKLRSLTLDQDALLTRGYDLTVSPDQRVIDKLRCRRCHKSNKKGGKGKLRTTHGVDNRTNICNSHPGGKAATGKLVNGEEEFTWSCCGKVVAKQDAKHTGGCEGHHEHDLPPRDDQAFADHWQFFETPALSTGPSPTNGAININVAHIQSASATSITSHREAVAMDCEMGYSSIGGTELIKISVVDVVSREVLINNLVKPDVEMKSMNTKFSGVSKEDMEVAIQNKTCFFGTAEVRQKLFEFVGQNTIVVVHAGENDMSATRLIHPLIVDTQTYYDTTSLAVLTEKFFGTKIQNGAHDSLEDALATRELVHRWMKREMSERVRLIAKVKKVLGPPAANLIQFAVDMVEKSFDGVMKSLAKMKEIVIAKPKVVAAWLRTEYK